MWGCICFNFTVITSCTAVLPCQLLRKLGLHCLIHMFTESRYLYIYSFLFEKVRTWCWLVRSEGTCVWLSRDWLFVLILEVSGYYDESLFSFCYDYSCHPTHSSKLFYYILIKSVLWRIHSRNCILINKLLLITVLGN